MLQASWKIDRGARRLSVAAPWQHPQAEKLDNISFSDWIEKNTSSREAQVYWRYLTEAGTCASAHSFSTLEVMPQIASLGGLKQLADSEFFVEGAQTIPQQMADELGDCVYLNAAVRSLKLQKQPVKVATDRGDFCGKRIILALPPQLIAKLSFDPALSVQLDKRPRHFVLGKVVKLAIVYENAWWRSYMEGALQSAERAIEEVLGEFANGAA